MLIFDTQIAAQQHLLRQVVRGYRFWTSGVAKTPEKLSALSEKFAEGYGTRMGKDRRHYRRKKGLVNAQAMAATLPNGQYLWFLVATDGVGPVRDQEKLLDAWTNSGRITWNGDYLLYEAKRPREHGGGTHWSWFLLPQRESEIANYMTHLVKTAPHDLNYYIQMQMHRPMHSGVRSQLTRILKSTKKLLERTQPDRKWPSVYPDKPLPILDGFRKRKEDSGQADYYDGKLRISLSQ
jgi:hypothetical protein